jgi:hypothetical protein
VIDFLARTHCPIDHNGKAAQENALALLGPAMFLARAAIKYPNSPAAWLHRQMLRALDLESVRSHLSTSSAHGLLWGFLASEPQGTAKEECGYTPALRGLSHFEDSGMVHFSDPDTGLNLSLQCGPPNGYRAYRNARGPCDRLAVAPRAGHFEVCIGKTPLLASPLGGYRLRTFLGNVMLVDGQGQLDDIGYPMSIPSWRDHGAEITLATWCEATQTGLVRMDLEPAYPSELGIALYLRDIVFESRQRIVVRDQVVLTKPRSLAWLFHARSDVGIKHEKGLRYRFGSVPCLFLEPRAFGTALTADVAQTDVVYSYTTFRPTFEHVSYDTTEKTDSVSIDFTITW